jgi:hypothetical protein
LVEIFVSLFGQIRRKGFEVALVVDGETARENENSFTSVVSSVRGV